MTSGGESKMLATEPKLFSVITGSGVVCISGMTVIGSKRSNKVTLLLLLASTD
jgi:hypothetical protein